MKYTGHDFSNRIVSFVRESVISELEEQRAYTSDKEINDIVAYKCDMLADSLAEMLLKEIQK